VQVKKGADHGTHAEQDFEAGRRREGAGAFAWPRIRLGLKTGRGMNNGRRGANACSEDSKLVSITCYTNRKLISDSPGLTDWTPGCR